MDPFDAKLGSNTGRDFQRCEKYRAPSWSWASTHGPCRFPRVSEGSRIVPELRATVIGCEMQYKTTNVYGEVTDGVLTISGKMKHTYVGKHKERLFSRPGSANPYAMGGHYSLFDDQTGNEVAGINVDDWRWHGSEIWIMPIQTTFSSCLEGLALVNVEAPALSRPRFQRVGLFTMHHGGNRFLNPELWLRDAERVTIDIV